MNIGKYETLIAVVESGSLTRAAQALGCTLDELVFGAAPEPAGGQAERRCSGEP